MWAGGQGRSASPKGVSDPGPDSTTTTRKAVTASLETREVGAESWRRLQPAGAAPPPAPARAQAQPRESRRAPPPTEVPRIPDRRLAAAAAGAGPGTGRRIQDGGRQEAASSRVGGKGESAAATPARLRPFPAGGRGGHWRLLTGGRTGAAKGEEGTTVYLRSPGLHLLAPLLLLILFHLPSRFLAGRPRGDGPTRRRLRSIYTPSPSPSPATTVTQT